MIRNINEILDFIVVSNITNKNRWILNEKQVVLIQNFHKTSLKKHLYNDASNLALPIFLSNGPIFFPDIPLGRELNEESDDDLVSIAGLDYEEEIDSVIVEKDNVLLEPRGRKWVPYVSNDPIPDARRHFKE